MKQHCFQCNTQSNFLCINCNYLGCTMHAKSHRKFQNHPLADFQDVTIILHQKFNPFFFQLSDLLQQYYKHLLQELQRQIKSTYDKLKKQIVSYMFTQDLHEQQIEFILKFFRGSQEHLAGKLIAEIQLRKNYEEKGFEWEPITNQIKKRLQQLPKYLKQGFKQIMLKDLLSHINLISTRIKQQSINFQIYTKQKNRDNCSLDFSSLLESQNQNHNQKQSQSSFIPQSSLSYNQKKKNNINIQQNLQVPQKKTTRKLVRFVDRPPEIIIGSLSLPYGLFIDDQGIIYFCQKYDRVITFSPQSEQYKIVAGGNGTGNNLNQLAFPTDVFVTKDKRIFVSEIDNHRVTEWFQQKDEGIIRAGGNGQGFRLDQLDKPKGILVIQNRLIIAEKNNNRIVQWVIGQKKGRIIANVTFFHQQLQSPVGLWLTQNGIIVTQWGQGNRILLYKNFEQQPFVIYGGYGCGQSIIQLCGPNYVVSDKFGNLYVSDSGNNRVLMINKKGKGRILFGGEGKGTGINQMVYCSGIFVDNNNGFLYCVDKGNGRILRKKIFTQQVLVEQF